ncbi:MAG TPA: molybdopterin-guanine dinucleotide biosynthesis protein B [Caldithrix sp.]|nr:molybdopterin-guanine dinucleotide biosynthesis protein B [Caldithrix sp.]
MIPHPRVLHVVGPKNSGKTALLKFLIGELNQRGYRVGALKHSSHEHPLDKPGSDSHLFAESGANPVIFVTPEGFGVFFHATPPEEQQVIWKQAFEKADIVLVESFRSAEGAKIVILNEETRLEEIENILAVVSDTNPPFKYPVFRHNDPRLVDFILNHFQLKK